MSKILVNNEIFTLVLDGEGYCISDNEIMYAFGDTIPTYEDSFILNPRSIIYSIDTKRLWAKSVNFNTGIVSSIRTGEEHIYLTDDSYNILVDSSGNQLTIN